MNTRLLPACKKSDDGGFVRHEMPVWGAVFEEEYERERYGSLTTLYHGRAPTDYRKSNQRK